MDGIIDKAKRPNSKWVVHEVYDHEYVLLIITPFPGCSTAV
jgi:hypothetical protein